jgi:hypothetical protein
MTIEGTNLNSDIAPGWYVRLTGDHSDLEEWHYTLKPPFDPFILREPDGTYLLMSAELSDAKGASEVHERAKALIDRLNGALTLAHETEPLKTGGVVRVDERGNRHVNVFAEAVGEIAIVSKALGVGVTIGPDGQPLPQPPEQESDVQQWNRLAAQYDLLADLLKQRGKASDWYEMYKTIELAERLVGGEHNLRGLLGDSAKKYKDLKRTANYYRHAPGDRPERLIKIGEGRSLLNFIVRCSIVNFSNNIKTCS